MNSIYKFTLLSIANSQAVNSPLSITIPKSTTQNTNQAAVGVQGTNGGYIADTSIANTKVNALTLIP